MGYLLSLLTSLTSCLTCFLTPRHGRTRLPTSPTSSLHLNTDYNADDEYSSDSSEDFIHETPRGMRYLVTQNYSADCGCEACVNGERASENWWRRENWGEEVGSSYVLVEG
ncbi:hypothetical protein B0J14DRAFT_599562 [Halenospora varia]|nr:hypothetical protein B0J14DRAFT_599562 [Halenospora varia]